MLRIDCVRSAFPDLSGRRRSPRWRHGGDGSHERQKAACWRGARTNSL